ncbi:MAG TPA: hypothetical protein VK588_12960 [Chitinophagaceae bacterium]|nr:hypothetical protein [Chitinophagaceae bacterium]
MILLSFFSQNIGFIIAAIAIACILFGRIWSNILNWGAITDPQSIIKGGENYKVINLYLSKGWTEGWEIGSIICLESFHSRFFVKKRREIYVSGDRIRFTDEGPDIGSFYKASFTNASSGSILMTQIKKPVAPKAVPKKVSK